MIDDFKLWINNPCTKLFYEWLIKDKQELLAQANNISFHSFLKAIANSTDPNKIYGICHGLERAIGKLEDIIEDAKEDKTDSIDEMVSFINNKE